MSTFIDSIGGLYVYLQIVHAFFLLEDIGYP